jgi:hypothetical protein
MNKKVGRRSVGGKKQKRQKGKFCPFFEDLSKIDLLGRTFQILGIFGHFCLFCLFLPYCLIAFLPFCLFAFFY